MKTRELLIVDDNRELADNMKDVLEESLDDTAIRGHIAGDGKEAIALCGSLGAALDLALVDLRLPDRSGFQLLSDVRQLCPFAQIIIMTGDQTVESAAAAVGAQVFAYVLKPFQISDILMWTRRALDHTLALRRAEALRVELEASERRNREVVEAIPAFVIALDEAGKIVLWNRKLEEVTGFSQAEMLSKDGSELVAQGSDRKLPLKSGGHRLVRWQPTEMMGEGEDRKSYAVGLDVTNERDMLRRTLQVERLAAVGTLAAGLAHEVRNPLNSATLQLQVLKRRIERGKSGPDDLLPVAGLVDSEIQRLGRLVNDFLAFARPKPLSLKRVTLNQLLENIADLMRPEVEARHVDFHVELDPATGEVELESERIRQVLLNLIHNALDAMPDGGTLNLRSFRADLQGMVRVEISDTGVGFPEDAPIFDAFYTTKTTGTGLGLSIAHRIVNEHGGLIRGESGGGVTRMNVFLPQHSQPGRLS
jgi:signal transduction histidine kinase